MGSAKQSDFISLLGKLSLSVLVPRASSISLPSSLHRDELPATGMIFPRGLSPLARGGIYCAVFGPRTRTTACPALRTVFAQAAKSPSLDIKTNTSLSSAGALRARDRTVSIIPVSVVQP